MIICIETAVPAVKVVADVSGNRKVSMFLKILIWLH